MIGTITQWLSQMAGETNQKAVRVPMKAIGDRESTTALTSAGLRIHGGSASAVVQGHTVMYAICQGILVTKPADTDMAALAGTVVNGTFNVFCHFIDQSGNLTTLMGIAGATLGAVVFPQFPETKAILGFTIINPTGTGNFVGGTTALDDATVVPNAVFVNTPSGFDPSILL